MILLSHPTGNANVRALLEWFDRRGCLDSFHTTLAVRGDEWYVRSLPLSLRDQVRRRAYAVPKEKIRTAPCKELVRLAATRWGWDRLTAHETGWACVDEVYADLDRRVAERIRRGSAESVYCYEGGALRTFRAAKELGLRRVYELPTPHWRTAQRLLREEALRLPRWAETLQILRDSPEKLERQDQEIALADLVVCPSRFVSDSLADAGRPAPPLVVAGYGCPPACENPLPPRAHGAPLRVLFAGALIQRKGLADVFSAMKLLKTKSAELVVMGQPAMPLSFYREFCDFTFEPPRPHRRVLELMRTCDVLLLPSLVEGWGLVLGEALSQGLPLIVTPNTGGKDLVEEGETGFVVPIRSPERIAEKLAWLCENRRKIPAMSERALAAAAAHTWDRYCGAVSTAMRAAGGR